jgi:BsuBI/PstI restriction endonuclease HTH domain/BsuBI/PstI restriction endonuclease domain
LTLPSLPTWEEVQQRLQVIFPEGAPNRGYLTRDLAASTVFVALYVGAVEGSGHWLGPKQVYRMSDIQAGMGTDAERETYRRDVMKPGGRAPGKQWYHDTTREPIRDETLREGLVVVGAAIERPDIATTSSSPRYALQSAFAALFDPALTGVPLATAITAWQSKHLSKGALARIALVRQGASTGGTHVSVTFPNGQILQMKPGPSSEITKAVIEVFAPRFLQSPAVVFVSESGKKVLAHHDAIARSIGLSIKADKNLPDTILVDLGPAEPLIVFVEAVATDGPIN